MANKLTVVELMAQKAKRAEYAKAKYNKTKADGTNKKIKTEKLKPGRKKKQEPPKEKIKNKIGRPIKQITEDDLKNIKIKVGRVPKNLILFE